MVHSLSEELEELVRDAGFVDVQTIKYRGYLGPAGAHLGPSYVTASFDNIQQLFGPHGVVVSAGERAEKAVRGAPKADDVRENSAMVLKEVERVGGTWTAIMVVGRKPK